MNKVVLLGRLTRDPDLNFAAGTGTAVCRFSLAVTRPFKKDETDFINCIAFGKTGETIAQYLTKGRQVAVTGSIRTGSYDAKDGTKRYTTDVVVESFEFIGNSKGSSNNQGGQSNNDFNNMGFEEDMQQVDYDDGCPF
ncbi:single-stranded DNA-binding protein [Clostridium tertium]